MALESEIGSARNAFADELARGVLTLNGDDSPRDRAHAWVQGVTAMLGEQLRTHPEQYVERHGLLDLAQNLHRAQWHPPYTHAEDCAVADEAFLFALFEVLRRGDPPARLEAKLCESLAHGVPQVWASPRRRRRGPGRRERTHHELSGLPL